MQTGSAAVVPHPILRELDALRARQDMEVRHMVARAVDAGARTQDIADALGVSRSTLWRRYRAELRRGPASSAAAPVNAAAPGPAGVSPERS